MLLYVIPSPSFAEGLLRGGGAGITVGEERGRVDAGAEEELWEELTLILVVSPYRNFYRYIVVHRGV